jgi:hypothetical protein
MRFIDADLSYAGHWKRGRMYVSRRAPVHGGFTFAPAVSFDDTEEAARWLLAEVGYELSGDGAEAIDRVARLLRDEFWTLDALEIPDVADGEDEEEDSQASPAV